MDQFSHDLTLALEETSLMDRACGVGRWGSRRRTRSTGNLRKYLPLLYSDNSENHLHTSTSISPAACAPQPTEDSSSSPTDTFNTHGHGQHPGASNSKMDGLETHTHNAMLPASDSDDKAEAMLPLRLGQSFNATAIRMCTGALESDSLNETNFSPAR